MEVIISFIENAEPWHWAALGGGVLLFFGIGMAASRSSPRQKFAGLQIRMFQIAPLGRDAYLQLYNPAEAVTLSQCTVIGRTDVIIKNHVAGQRLLTGGEYSILMEVSGKERLDNDFTIDLKYMVEGQQQAYQQRLLLAEGRVEKPRRV